MHPPALAKDHRVFHATKKIKKYYLHSIFRDAFRIQLNIWRFLTMEIFEKKNLATKNH